LQIEASCIAKQRIASSATDRDTSRLNVRLGAALLPMALTAGVTPGYNVVQ
jgi:hypothetical protein